MVSHVVARKAHDDDKLAWEEASKFEADNVAEMGCRRDGASVFV